ncbi:cytochrome P450 [Apodospora peruviana]|uniref:Cytochrome P450 n=1 Tax=Apodospora peruviana TaxID=516989 RepID=A0AAE0HV40_9PEZI|nr:cytochrome P450 [Apodospora peruviana]
MLGFTAVLVGDSSPVYVVVVGVSLIAVLLFSANFIYNIYFHPLASFPGPLHYRGSEIPHLIQEWRGNTVHKWTELHSTYGDVVRIAPNQLSYISVNAWRDIYGCRGTPSIGSNPAAFTHAGAGPKGTAQMLKEELVFPGDDFEFFAPAKPMISCDAVSHARHRRAVGPAFSDKAVRSFEPVIVQYVEDMLDKLQEQQHNQQFFNSNGVDIMDWFHFVMFDITSALVFGKSFGNMANAKYHPWVARIFPGMKLIAWSMVIAAVPGLGRLVSWLLPKKMVDEARLHMQSIVDMTDSRFSSSQKLEQQPDLKPDFMTYIHPQIGNPKNQDHSSLSTEELYLNSQLLCIAGSETTASLLAGAVYFLSQPANTHHLNRLLAELQSNFSSETEITPSGLNSTKTPFLAAVLNECLRLYPPGAINMPRTVPPGGATVDGRFVPGGSIVGIAQYAAYRSPTHWRNPLTFAPERWLQSEEGPMSVYANDRREVFKPFSYGPRNCVGQNLAVAECRLITARLFWRFEVDMFDGQGDWINGQRTFLSWEKPPLRVKLTARKHL